MISATMQMDINVAKQYSFKKKIDMLINRYISNSSYFKNHCLFLFTLYVVNKGLRLIVAFFSVFEFFRIIVKREGKNNS